MIEQNERQSKTQVVYEDLKERIINNEFKQGTRLVERNLCDHYQSSRTPIREALRLLHNEGLVQFVRGSSVTVSNITYEMISELYDIREVLEGLSARLCAENINETELEQLSRMYDKFCALMEQKEYQKALKQDVEIHHFIIAMSRNGKLSDLLTPVFNQSKRIVNLTTYTNGWATETFNHHTAIFEAIRNRDGAAAERIMREHIRNSKKHQIENLNKLRYR